jgi:hypothetical protein
MLKMRGLQMKQMGQFIKDNWEEWFIGFILGLGFFPVLGIGAIVLGVGTGILYRMGGAGIWKTKGWRRVGIPVLLVAVNHLPLLYSVGAGLATFGLLTVGYGHIDRNDSEGSPFGNWCWKVSGENEVLSLIMSRGLIVCGIWITWGIAYGLSQGR